MNDESKIASYLNCSTENLDTMEIMVSGRLLNPDPNVKEPEKWVIKRVPRSVAKALRKACRRVVSYGDDADAQRKIEIDYDEYCTQYCAESLVYPDLYESKWQEKYGGKNPGEVLDNMLTEGEFMRLLKASQDFSGYNEPVKSEVDRVKNS